MRIVGGRFRGKKLQAPREWDGRPTSDRTRESIFNILAHGIEGGDPAGDGAGGLGVLDLFCGTGALGLEALSRGADRAVFIDADPVALRAVKANAGAMGLARAIVALSLDATRLAPPPRLVRAPFDLAFLDPPYHQDLAAPALLALAQRGWLAPGAVVVLEQAADEKPPALPAFEALDNRTYGAAQVTFLRHRG